MSDVLEGARVRYVSDFDDFTDEGSIIEVLEDGRVLVEWDDFQGHEETILSILGLTRNISTEVIGLNGVTLVE